MRTIAIINQKGGVGKTTTAVNLSAALAESGKRVQLIDVDPQAHASLHLGLGQDDASPTTYELLIQQAEAADVRQQVGENLWVLPAHLDLAAAELELADTAGRECVLRNRLAADPMDFDFTVIDCPPSLGILTLNALTTAEEVILPLQPHFLALHGFSKLLRTIEIVSQRLNDRLQLSGVVLCMFDAGTRLAMEVSADVEAFFSDNVSIRTPWARSIVFETRIRRNIRLAEAPSYGQSILDYSPQSNGAVDYRQLCLEIMRLESRVELSLASRASTL